MKLKAAALLGTLVVAGSAFAQGKAPEPDYTLSYNVGVVSDYRYRGISQTRLEPALQGGIDFAHKSGFYLGAWASTIKWIKDAGATKGSVELDLYGGYKGTVGAFGYDVGYLRYQYVGNKLADTGIYKNANTDELYIAGTYGPATLKYSHSLGNLFGNYNFTTNEKTSGSGYLDLSATFDLGNGFSVTPHVGHQRVANLSIASYTDTSVTLAKDMGNGLSLSAMAVTTNADKTFYVTPTWDGSKFTGKSALVLGAKYSF
jgi:uncharacterized protein (TIGR02001 family)